MKRFVLAGIISALAAAAALSASCTWMPDDDVTDDRAILIFDFVRTKADALPDTNSFTLKVLRSGESSPVYEGAYGNRPREMKVDAGTYEISVMSRSFSAPEFDAPLFGEEKIVVATAGETLHVAFLCTQLNCGVKISFSDNFKNKYSNGALVLRQSSGELSYGYQETRTAYLMPGSTEFIFNDGVTETSLFKRSLGAGELRMLSLDATVNETTSSFSIAVDTTVTRISELITIGEESSGDGMSMATAYSPGELLTAERAGDTVWVWGYIVGTIVDDNTVDFVCDTTTADNNIAIAASASETSSAACVGIYLSKAAQKNVLNVKNPDNKASILHRKVFVQGKVDVYKKITTLKNICDYRIE